MEFFTNSTHQLIVTNCVPKASTDENRISLTFDLALEEKVLDLVSPREVRRAYQVVSVEKLGIPDISIKTEIRGVDFEFFQLSPGDKYLKNDAAVLITLRNTIVRNMKVHRPAKPLTTKGDIKLRFSVIVGWDREVWRWAGDFFSYGVYAKFSESQGDLDEAPGDAEDKPAEAAEEANSETTLDGEAKLTMKRGICSGCGSSTYVNSAGLCLTCEKGKPAKKRRGKSAAAGAEA